MKKIKYLITRINKDTFKKLKIKIEEVQSINHKNKLIILIDMFLCSILYGAGYTDYYAFAMYDMNKEERKTILTRGKNNTYVAMFNKKEDWHIFDNKNEFNEKYNKYLKRDWMYLKGKTIKDLDNFTKKHPSFIAKPNNDCGGHGIEKINKKDFKNSEELYKYLINKNLLLLEELIIQHEVLNKINKSSVNTIRIITLRINNKTNFIKAFLRIGNNNYVDNTASGGMLTIIDLNTGITMYDACDGKLNTYKYHPISKEPLKGIKIPYFKEIKDLVVELSEKEENLKYIAWDVAVTDNGPVIVEANPYPGYYYQFKIHTPNKIGIIPTFNKILNK